MCILLRMPITRVRKLKKPTAAQKRAWEARRKKKGKKLSPYSSLPPTYRTNTLGVSRSKKVNLRYCDEISINPAVSGIPTRHVFRANSLFDPDFTGTGHQPLGYDQWGVFYNKYTVIGSSITIEAFNSDTAIPVVVGISTFDTSSHTGTNTIGGCMEQPNTVHKTQGKQGAVDTALVLRQNVNPFKFLKKKFGDDGMTGQNFSLNPGIDLYYHIWAASLGGADGAAVDILVTIDYVAILTDPNQVTQS